VLFHIIVLFWALPQSSSVPKPLRDCQDFGVTNPAGAVEFLSELKRVVERNDRDAVKSMVRFPASYGDPEGPAFLDEKGFADKYDMIFNKKTRQILAKQTSENLYCDQGSLGIGDGEVWLAQVQGTQEFQVVGFDHSKYSRAGIETMEQTAEVDAFFENFQKAIAMNQKDLVASMTLYPLSVYTQKGAVRIANRADLIKRYDFVFDQTVKSKLESLTSNDLFATDHGIGAGDGVVWIGPPLSQKKLGPTLVVYSTGNRG
jgi:hypothetical protein